MFVLNGSDLFAMFVLVVSVPLLIIRCLYKEGYIAVSGRGVEGG